MFIGAKRYYQGILNVIKFLKQDSCQNYNDCQDCPLYSKTLNCCWQIEIENKTIDCLSFLELKRQGKI